MIAEARTRGVKPKLNLRTMEELLRQARSRWDSLPEEQKKRWGGFDKYFNAALQEW